MKKVKPEEYKPRMQSDNVIVPAFLNKLWNMVNEPYTDNLICWSEVNNIIRLLIRISVAFYCCRMARASSYKIKPYFGMIFCHNIINTTI